MSQDFLRKRATRKVVKGERLATYYPAQLKLSEAPGARDTFPQL